MYNSSPVLLLVETFSLQPSHYFTALWHVCIDLLVLVLYVLYVIFILLFLSTDELVSKSRLPSSCSVQLYNITADPTESNDLSKSEPGVVRLLLRKLSAHELTARRPFYPRPTTLCNPALHGNVWAPYIEIA